jgi:hypothetical protein
MKKDKERNEREEGGRTGKDREPPQFARNDGVLAVEAKAEKIEGSRPTTFHARVKKNPPRFSKKFP